MTYSTLFAGFLFAWNLSAQGGAAEFLEITAELDSTWETSTKTNHNNFTTRCVFGTNSWLIEGDFHKNARVSYWLVGSNVIEQTVITSSMYIQQAKDLLAETILGKPQAGPIVSYPRAGEISTTIHPAPEGQPAGSGVAKAVWLAFCSGPYLQKNGRNVPLPIGAVRNSWGCVARTVTFDDRLNLPAHVQFFSSDDRLVDTYQVLESTNFVGRNLPLKFKIVQHGVGWDGELNFSTKTEVTGKVISIRLGDNPKPPDEVLNQIEKAD